MDFGWHEMIEGTVRYYQINFNTSNIVAQLSEYGDILKKRF